MPDYLTQPHPVPEGLLRQSDESREQLLDFFALYPIANSNFTGFQSTIVQPETTETIIEQSEPMTEQPEMMIEHLDGTIRLIDENDKHFDEVSERIDKEMEMVQSAQLVVRV
ncbi:hypothetical protein BGZ65_001864 [Modicella reniformis]|uniref:Uncharacterized protein n=1 Tax=Modicella reniformis TaxID=1440133 RepID=A0A9P6M9W9_9FUNG|nr:hypothetical protein BGZ65_001864 [Modicella reniformis]